MTARSVGNRVRAHLGTNMAKAMVIGLDEVKRKFREPKVGKLYWRKDGTQYRASASSRETGGIGQAPAIKEGDLDKSMKTSVGIRRGQVVGVLSADTKYARGLEFGDEAPLKGRHSYLEATFVDRKRDMLKVLFKP
jgi:hypothetical protein